MIGTLGQPPRSVSAERRTRGCDIIGAVIGSLAFLMLILGGGVFFFIRRQRHRNLERHLSHSPKMIPELSSRSSPVGSVQKQIREMTPHSKRKSQDTVGGSGTVSAEVGVSRIPCTDILLCGDVSSMGRSTNAIVGLAKLWVG